jgi:hypothetical protein
LAETIKKCFDEKNTRFQNEEHIIVPNKNLKINDIFNIPSIVRTLKSPIVVHVLKEIIDSQFFESLIEFIAVKSERDHIYSNTFDLVKS